MSRIREIERTPELRKIEGKMRGGGEGEGEGEVGRKLLE
jgi:hypothetical protein